MLLLYRALGLRCACAAGAALNSSALCVIERNLISSSRPPPPPAAARLSNMGHINHKKVLLGERSASRPLSHYPGQTHPEPQTRPPVLFLILSLANLSFLVFQQESNNLIPGAFIPPPPPLLSFKSFPPCSQHSALLPFFLPPGFQAASTHTFCLRLITSLMEPLY